MESESRDLHHNQKNVDTFEPTELMIAVESLYNDHLKPYGRILRKRFAEFRNVIGFQGEEVDVAGLRTACESCPWLCVELEDGGDWCALLVGRLPCFVDVYSPQDAYPERMWFDAALYFELLGSLGQEERSLPGGRYSCAQSLAARNLPFLQGFSLGQICHIVQLAISQRKLLGYHNGTVVPYASSQSKVKERCAERNKPCASTSRGMGPWPLATWDMVRGCLREIFCSIAPGAGTGLAMVSLSNIKRLFRARFHIELSETALGHSKLSELLQDARLSDICAVKLQGNGYIVTPPSPQPCQLHRRAHAICLADELAPPHPIVSMPLPAIPMPTASRLAPAALLPSLCGSALPSSSSFLWPGASSSFCMDVGPPQGHSHEQDVHARGCCEPFVPVAQAQPQPAHVYLFSEAVRSPFAAATLFKVAPAGSIVKNGFIEFAPTPQTQLRGNSRHRARSLPKDIGCSRDVCQSIGEPAVDPFALPPSSTCAASPVANTPAYLYCSTPSLSSPEVCLQTTVPTTEGWRCSWKSDAVEQSTAVAKSAFAFCATPLSFPSLVLTPREEASFLRSERFPWDTSFVPGAFEFPLPPCATHRSYLGSTAIDVEQPLFLDVSDPTDALLHAISDSSLKISVNTAVQELLSGSPSSPPMVLLNDDYFEGPALLHKPAMWPTEPLGVSSSALSQPEEQCHVLAELFSRYSGTGLAMQADSAKHEFSNTLVDSPYSLEESGAPLCQAREHEASRTALVPMLRFPPVAPSAEIAAEGESSSLEALLRKAFGEQFGSGASSGAGQSRPLETICKGELGSKSPQATPRNARRTPRSARRVRARGRRVYSRASACGMKDCADGRRGGEELVGLTTIGPSTVSSTGANRTPRRCGTNPPSARARVRRGMPSERRNRIRQGKDLVCGMQL